MYRKIICEKLSTNFRECTKVVSAAIPQAASAGAVIVKNDYCGINASDVNYTAGRYQPGIRPPFDTGFEAVGRIATVGEGVEKFKPGDAVVYADFGAFSEYKEVPAKAAIPIPAVMPEALTLVVSGLTASIALKEVGEMKEGETVLVTAAAGGTGSYAVQLAKQAGCHVIGTCSSDEKAETLKKLGCDRPINYKKEELYKVLKQEYPNGIDVVYESVGGDIFEACLNNLAVHGRLIVIGFIAGYQDGTGWAKGQPAQGSRPIPSKLLALSASMRGFFLYNHVPHFKNHMGSLLKMVQGGNLIPLVDPTPFKGIEAVPDAIDWMYSGKNTVTLPTHFSPLPMLGLDQRHPHTGQGDCELEWRRSWTEPTLKEIQNTFSEMASLSD